MTESEAQDSEEYIVQNDFQITVSQKNDIKFVNKLSKNEVKSLQKHFN